MTTYFKPVRSPEEAQQRMREAIAEAKRYADPDAGVRYHHPKHLRIRAGGDEAYYDRIDDEEARHAWAER